MITSQPCALLSRAIWLSPSRRWKDIEDKGSPLLKSGPWNQPKIWFGHNFWLEGPINLRRTRLNCILQDLFRDIPLDHIACAQICTRICQIWPNMPNMHIWVRAIWSSGVSLKRSCKMQFRRVSLRSIDPPVKSYDKIKFLADFPIVITM